MTMIVTIVTPTLNAATYLRQCIESVKQNEGIGYKIDHVIADGGSTDGTLQLAESYRLRIIYGKDRSIYEAINQASFDSPGELLGCLCSDDLMLEGALQAVVDAYLRSGKRWVVGGTRWIDNHGSSLGELAAPPTWLTSRMHACLGWSTIAHMSTYFSREFFVELNGFNTEFNDCGDYEMFSRALAAASYERIARPLACFRRTGMNNSVINAKRTKSECISVLETFGPKASWERTCWRYILKTWVNTRNPGWAVAKYKGRICWRLGLQETKYV